MRCQLMHKDVVVAGFEMDEQSGSIVGRIAVDDSAHMPLGTMVKGDIVDPVRFREWWVGRSIPASRSGVRMFFEALGIHSCMQLLARSMALSLSDHYWVRPLGSDVQWHDINFFDNDFSDDIGDLLFGNQLYRESMSLSSPDITTEGNLKKRWRIVNGRRVLFKGGSGNAKQEPLNEVIASRLMERMGVDHVGYELVWEGRQPYSVCEDFATSSTEFISAYHVMRSMPNRSNASVYGHYVACCREHGLDVVPDLDRMILTDHLMANVDRHTNNFGILRDPDTLEWIASAPVFDTGTSLGANLSDAEIRMSADEGCKPFARTFRKQLELVTDISWIDADSMDSVSDYMRSVLGSSMHITDDRRDAIIESFDARVKSIEKML